MRKTGPEFLHSKGTRDDFNSKAHYKSDAMAYHLSIAKDPSPSIVECHGFHPTFFVPIPKGLFVVSFKKSSTRSFYCLAMENKYN